MLILSWNLFHGRAIPDRPRSLQDEFTAALAAWRWDVALLQEVPPWWPVPMAAACGAQQRLALTSRNWLLPLRRAIARRRPDLIKSNGGGCNAILVRGHAIEDHRVRGLRLWPERRVAHGVLLDSGIWCCNIHAQVRPHSETRKDISRAGEAVDLWAGEMPVIVGGDFNIRDPAIAGFEMAPGSSSVDQVLARGVDVGPAQALRREGLSDHAPILVEVGAGI
jgi:endonuclease/exonuclease/phosphatase family metal-dependent hydrolase